MEKNLITKSSEDFQQALNFSGEKMTVKQVAEVLECHIDTIHNWIDKLFPDIKQNGKTTYLNEIQVTAIKLKMAEAHNLRNVPKVQTKLERALLIQQALHLQQEIIEEQQAEIDVLKPKAIQYDTFMSNDGNQKIGDVAKIFNIKPHKLFQMLRDAKILKDNYVPYSGFEQYFKTIESATRGGFNVFTSFIKPAGVDYIAKRFNLQQTA